MNTVFASDLDRTLVYSARAFWFEMPDDEAPALVVSEVYRGEPISFMTRASESRLQSIGRSVAFVPVTTRTVAQYRRIRLPVGASEYAVTSNGGVILHHGSPDEEWTRRVREVLTGVAAIGEIEGLLEEPSRRSWITRIARADDLFTYAIVDRAAMQHDDLLTLEGDCVARGWSVSVQGRKLYCIPHGLDKRDAVAEVASRLDASTVLAAGDSLLDQSMLEAADRAIRPAHGELHERAFSAPNLTVTRERGILAGEEILDWVAAEIASVGRE